MTNREVAYKLSLRDEASSQWERFEKDITLGAKRIQSMISSVGPIIGAAFSGVALNQFVSKSNEAEIQTAKLRSALAAQGVTSESVIADMQAYSEAVSKKVAIDDDDITGIQAQIVGMTGLSGQAVQPLTKAVLDLAAGMNMDVESATRMISKTAEGADALKRMGITIGETSNEQERIAKTAEAIEQKFGGMAEALGSTAAGKIKNYKISWENVEEKFGDVIKKVEGGITPALSHLLDLVQAAPVGIQAMILALGGLAAVAVTLGIALTPISLGIGAIIAAGVGLAAWAGSSGDSIAELTKQMSSLKEGQAKLANIDTVAASYDTLRSKINLNKVETEQLKKAIADLAGFMPTAVTSWDDHGNAVEIDTGAIRRNIEARRDYLALQERDFILSNIVEPMKSALKAYDDTGEGIKRSREALGTYKAKIDDVNTSIPGMTFLVGVLKNELDHLSSSINNDTISLDAQREKFGELLSLMSAKVDVKNFDEVTRFLKTLGVESGTIDLFKQHWNEMLVGYNAGMGTKPKKDAEAMAGSIELLSKVAKDAQTALDRLSPSSDQYGAASRRAAEATFALTQAQEKEKAKGDDIIAQLIVQQRHLAAMPEFLSRLAAGYRQVTLKDLNDQLSYLNTQLNKTPINTPAFTALQRQIEDVEKGIKKATASLQELKPIEIPAASLEKWGPWKNTVESMEVHLMLVNDILRTLGTDTPGFDQMKAKAAELQAALDMALSTPIERFQETFTQATGFLSQGLGILAQAEAQAAQGRINSLEREKAATLKGIDTRLKAERSANDQRKKEIDLLLASDTVSAAEKKRLTLERMALDEASAQREANLQAEKEKASDAYDAKIRQAKREAFAAEKNAKVIESLINTAVQITQVLAKPWMIPIVAALGAAQTAVIMSQPTPEFHSGGTVGQAEAGKKFQGPPSKEFIIKTRGGETIRTEDQESIIQRKIARVNETIRTMPPTLREYILGDPAIPTFHAGGTVPDDPGDPGWTIPGYGEGIGEAVHQIGGAVHKINTVLSNPGMSFMIGQKFDLKGLPKFHDGGVVEPRGRGSNTAPAFRPKNIISQILERQASFNTMRPTGGGKRDMSPAEDRPAARIREMIPSDLTSASTLSIPRDRQPLAAPRSYVNAGTKDEVQAAGVIHLTVNFNSPIPHGEYILESIKDVLRKTGLTIDKVAVDNRSKATLS